MGDNNANKNRVYPQQPTITQTFYSPTPINDFPPGYWIPVKQRSPESVKTIIFVDPAFEKAWMGPSDATYQQLVTSGRILQSRYNGEYDNNMFCCGPRFTMECLDSLTIEQELINMDNDNRTGSVTESISSHLNAFKRAFVGLFFIFIFLLLGIGTFILAIVYQVRLSHCVSTPLLPILFFVSGSGNIAFSTSLIIVIVLRVTCYYKKRKLLLKIGGYIVCAYVILSLMTLCGVSLVIVMSKAEIDCAGRVRIFGFIVACLPYVWLLGWSFLNISAFCCRPICGTSAERQAFRILSSIRRQKLRRSRNSSFIQCCIS
ncbi:hypothetical protein I4U23_022140 [Adineta vaga]|nr:hypothetical protein I4U23_022140 [Adineta vaga]